MILKLKRTPGIFLVGFMGCGKTTIGRALADELGWNFCDLDEEIEKSEQTTVADIFDARGETVFREIETATLKRHVRAVERGQPQVIALGGGAFVSDANFELVSNHGVPIWIDCAFETIERRVAAEAHRPLGRDPQRLRELFEERKPFYARADYRIECAEDDAACLVAKILALPLFKP